MRSVNLIFVFLALAVAACRSADSKQSGDVADKEISETTRVKLIDSTYNFGKIKEGERVEFSYRFKNTGKHPLKIASVYSSCGCTVPEFSKEPVMPGKKGFIKVTFNSDGVGGEIEKFVEVRSNAKPDFPRLILSGKIINE